MFITATKKPVHIKAIIFEDTPECVNAIKNYVGEDIFDYNALDPENPRITIKHEFGAFVGNVGDYVYQDSNGQFVACPADLFFELFDLDEPVEEYEGVIERM